jgi:hypothetical protein
VLCVIALSFPPRLVEPGDFAYLASACARAGPLALIIVTVIDECDVLQVAIEGGPALQMTSQTPQTPGEFRYLASWRPTRRAAGQQARQAPASSAQVRRFPYPQSAARADSLTTLPPAGTLTVWRGIGG